MPRLLPALGVLLMTHPDADAQGGYRTPPDPIPAILNAPPFPAVTVSPTRDVLVLAEPERYPPVAELARPMLRLAGLRIDPATNGPAQPARSTGKFTLTPLDAGKPRELLLGPGAWTGPDFSPDGKWFALTRSADGSETTLILVRVASGQVIPVAGLSLNAAVADPVRWAPDSRSLLLATVPAGRGKPPEAPAGAAGPVVQETSGKAAPVRTFQDLLKSPHDAALFDHYATAQLVRITLPAGNPADPTYTAGVGTTVVGRPVVLTGFDPSPDGRFVLVARVRPPYSYLHPYTAFPRTVEVWDAAGKPVHTVADLPAADAVPIEGVPTGPRGVRWVPTEPATLMWAEARDDGDPRKAVPHRDELFTHAAPFAGRPRPGYKTVHRFAGASFFDDGTALVSDYDRDRRWTTTVRVNPADPVAEPKPVFDRSAQDRYNDPGSPVLKTTPAGQRVIRTSGGNMLLSGAGASPAGDRPFLDRFDPATGDKSRLFQCRPGVYESVAAVLADDGRRLLVRRESPTDPPNLFLRDGDAETPLTAFADPFPELRKVTKQLVTTKRADGVTVSFTLYLPPGAKAGEKLPAVFWAYPREFNSADTAGQVSGSADRFFLPTAYSHLFLLTRGYAVLDEVSMPVVGPPDRANDTFVEQLVMTAKAAIDRACELGPIDRDRVGVGGHSYGAFMTANLLAHSDLFRAGVARSGAYNRTLTPFGFQNERRTFWEAPDVYARMSPFNSADRIKEPLLLIHGQDDSNPGTFPMQSERLYQAVRGTGGTARLVLLPHESHGYRGRESVLHVLAETADWFDRHVKGAKPR